MKESSAYKSLIGGKSRSWVKLLVSIIRLADVARWKHPLQSDSTAAPAESITEDSPKLLYYEIAVVIIEYLMEEDRNNRGNPVSLEPCIENILFNTELIKKYPDLKDAAVERVISALETPTLLIFQLLVDQEVEQDTAIIGKIASRDIRKYYLTDTGRMLCGLSFRIDDLKNLDLSIQFLLRMLKDGEFSDFIIECGQRIDSIHSLSARIRKISTMSSWPAQWQNILAERDRVKRVLDKTIDLVNECIETLDTDVVQGKIQSYLEYKNAPANLRFQLEEWLYDVVGALNGLRSTFSDLIRLSEKKRRNVVQEIDFFKETKRAFSEGNLTGSFVDDQLETFGLWGLRHLRIKNEPFASTSAVDVLRPVQMRESHTFEEAEVLPPPPSDKRVIVYSERDEMLRSHGKRILDLLEDLSKLRLSEYLDTLHGDSEEDRHIPALFSLFIDPSPLSIFEVEVISALVETTPSVTWTKSDGNTLHFTDLEIMKKGA